MPLISPSSIHLRWIGSLGFFLAVSLILYFSTTQPIKDEVAEFERLNPDLAVQVFGDDGSIGDAVSFEHRLKKWYEDLKLPVVTPQILDLFEQRTFTIPEEPRWREPLGNRICIVDIDNRPFDEPHELLDSSSGNTRWSSLTDTSSGMLGHYLYAMTHGYDYRLIITKSFEDRAPYWTKIPALSNILGHYDIVVSIDADAQFHHHQIPFEWLLNRWEIGPHTAMAMAIDPPDKDNYDSRGNLSINAGFIVAQNIPRTHEILKAWAACPDETSSIEAFQGCAKYKNGWPAEQGAFANIIRYMYADDLLQIDCDDANGSRKFRPKMFGKHHAFKHSCQGRFVEHHTLTKPEIKNTVLRGPAKMIEHRLTRLGHDLPSTKPDDVHPTVRALAAILLEKAYRQFRQEEATLVIRRDNNDF